MHTFTHQHKGDQNTGFKPKRLAHLQMNKLPGVGLITSVPGAAVNAVETGIYGVASTAATVPMIAGTVKRALWDNGIAGNWGIEDALTLGGTKVAKIGASVLRDQADAEKSVVKHLGTTAVQTGLYGAASVLRAPAGIMGDHIGDVVPSNQIFDNLRAKVKSGLSSAYNSAQATGTTAAPAPSAPATSSNGGS